MYQKAQRLKSYFERDILQIRRTSTLNNGTVQTIDPMHKCSLVLRKLIVHPFSFWFTSPVDPVVLKIPTYFDEIKHPMGIYSF